MRIPFFFDIALTRFSCAGLLCAVVLLAGAKQLNAETGREGWLGYSPLSAAAKQQYQRLPLHVVQMDDSPVTASARRELIRGLSAMLGRTFRAPDKMPDHTIVLGTMQSMKKVPDFQIARDISDGGFELKTHRIHGVEC